nr:cob(I)yrinic acid a,c-diamide adenosyltransferase [Lachnospiraceae bacterium]
MIQIYTGDGKGKTQSAIGATIRGAGHGLPVLFCQFLKDDSSGEISILKELKEVEVFHAPKDYGFYFQMSEEEKAFTKKEAKLLFNQVIEKAKVKFDGDFLKRNEEFDSAIAKSSVTTLGDREEMAVKGIIVFDELLVALDLGILEEDDVRNT